MVKKIHHVEKIHHSLGIDDATRHQGGAKTDIVEVSNNSRMSQFLLVEVSHLELSPKC